MKTKSPKKKTEPLFVMCRGVTLLALDVSSSAMGWAVCRFAENGKPEIVDFDVVRPPSGWSFDRKVYRMIEAVDRIEEKHRVTWACMEFQSHKSAAKHVQGLAVLGQAQGAIWNHLDNTTNVDRISEREWTKFGGRNTSKAARCEFVKLAVPAYAKRLAEDPKFDPGMDAADALGLLLYRASLRAPIEDVGPAAKIRRLKKGEVV